MTKQQKTTTAYTAYIELLVSPFTNVKHIDAPSAEISRVRRLIGILIDSVKIESAESIDDAYWAKVLSRLSTRSVIRHPKNKEGEYTIICFKDISGNVDIR